MNPRGTQQAYRVISVSTYETDLATLDAEVERRKAGFGRLDEATRSGVLRELVRRYLPPAQRSGE
jgi:uncharacterized small protein (DUF1192 family)